MAYIVMAYTVMVYMTYTVMAYVVMAYIVMAFLGRRVGLLRRVQSSRARISFFFNIFSEHADGERRGLDRIAGQRRKGLGETHL